MGGGCGGRIGGGGAGPVGAGGSEFGPIGGGGGTGRHAALFHVVVGDFESMCASFKFSGLGEPLGGPWEPSMESHRPPSCCSSISFRVSSSLLMTRAGCSTLLLVERTEWFAVTISSRWRISELSFSFPMLPGVGRLAPTSKLRFVLDFVCFSGSRMGVSKSSSSHSADD